MRALPLLVIACLSLVFASTAAANPWLGRRVLHMAHQGGERESPSNTMFAYERAIANGADMLEMDVNITKDGHIVVCHDTTVDGRTNGSGRVNELTLAQIKQLDAADTWPEYRGIALGLKPPPEGFTAEDFRIPTLREVLERYPKMLMNIEIKGDSPDLATQGFLEDMQAGRPTIFDAADALAALLGEYKRFGDTVVVSFSDSALTRFESQADPRIDTAAGLGTTAAFFGSGAGPAPGFRHPWKEALQPPTFFEGIEVPTKDFVTDAHANGQAVHVWLTDDAEEAPATYGKLVANGVDGIMTDRPSRLEAFLAENGLRWKKPKKPAKRSRAGKRAR